MVRTGKSVHFSWFEKDHERAGSIAELLAEHPDSGGAILPGLVGPGITVLAGPPTVGKGKFAQDLALAVALDSPFLAFQPPAGLRALYVNTRTVPGMLAQEFRAIDAEMAGQLEGRFGVFSRFGTAESAETALDHLILGPNRDERHYDFVVIDDIDHLKGKGLGGFLRDARSWSWNHSIPMLLVANLSPTKTRNPISALSDLASTHADTVLLFDGTAERTTLRVLASGVETKHVALSNENGWAIKGEATQEAVSESRAAILNVLKDAEELMGPKALHYETGIDENVVNQLLYKMRRDKQVVLVEKGRYRHPDRPELQAVGKTE